MLECSLDFYITFICPGTYLVGLISSHASRYCFPHIAHIVTELCFPISGPKTMEIRKAPVRVNDALRI
jgi:hypothetical protein